jgi:hypothetical protein
MLLARFPDGRQARVYVKFSSKFRRGMVIPPSLLDKENVPRGATYRVLRLPRFYGRW